MEVPACDWSEERRERVLQRVANARMALNSWIRFFGHLSLSLRPRIAEPSDRVDSAAVSMHGDLILNVDYIESLSDAKVRGLVCHEVMHPAMLCFQRRGHRDVLVVDPNTGRVISLWNLAHDFAIDSEIDACIRNCGKTGLIEIPDATINPDWFGWSAEEIYEALLKKAKENTEKQKKQNGGQCSGGGDGGLYMTSPTSGGQRADDARADLSGDGKNDGEPDGLNTDESPRQAAKMDSATADKWRLRMVAAAQVHERDQNIGALSAGLLKYIKEILEPKVDWRHVLSAWTGEHGVVEDFTYRRPGRRSESIGEYMPSRTNWGVDDIVVFWDRSGSRDGMEKQDLGEMQGICEDLGVGIRVLIGDTDVLADVTDVTDALTMIEELKGVPGGGGSDFRPFFKKLEDEQYEGVIVAFTDGHIFVPTMLPQFVRAVLWVIQERDVDPTRHYGGKVPWGTVLRVYKDGSGRLESRT